MESRQGTSHNHSIGRREAGRHIFDFELTAGEMSSFVTLDTATSSFFDHLDPAMVKMLGEAQRPT